MTKFESLKGQFATAVERLDEVLRAEKSVIIRDAALKRFEFTYDLAWKAARAFLQEKKGVDCTAPKDCIKAAYQQKLIDYNDIWLNMTDWRNQIVHSYSEKFADELFAQLPQILSEFQKLLKKL